MDPGGSGRSGVEVERGEGPGKIVSQGENSAEHEEAAREVIGVWVWIRLAIKEAGGVKGLRGVEGKWEERADVLGKSVGGLEPSLFAEGLAGRRTSGGVDVQPVDAEREGVGRWSDFDDKGRAEAVVEYGEGNTNEWRVGAQEGREGMSEERARGAQLRGRGGGRESGGDEEVRVVRE